MNEKIKELAISCYVTVGDYSYCESVFDIQKFAELIIKECANYAFSDDQERTAMLKHFGAK